MSNFNCTACIDQFVAFLEAYQGNKREYVPSADVISKLRSILSENNISVETCELKDVKFALRVLAKSEGYLQLRDSRAVYTVWQCVTGKSLEKFTREQVVEIIALFREIRQVYFNLPADVRRSNVLPCYEFLITKIMAMTGHTLKRPGNCINWNGNGNSSEKMFQIVEQKLLESRMSQLNAGVEGILI